MAIKPGKMSFRRIKNLLNKKAGKDANVAWNLNDPNNPTNTKEWISTGSRWLDSIICKGKMAGIPVSKITEIAGLSASGKSFMAAKICANAQKMGIIPIYYDSEMALDNSFFTKMGVDLNSFLYVQAKSVEFVFESILEIMEGDPENRYLFVWDSLALTKIKDSSGGLAEKARIISAEMPDLMIPLADHQGTFLVLNQLKSNISSDIWEVRANPYVTPGGKTGVYAYSLRVWLTRRNAKSSKVLDDNGFIIGSEVAVQLKKSRFGTELRKCAFKILWADDNTVGIMDEESWLEAIRTSDHFISKGGWRTILNKDGTELKKFQESSWLEQLNEPAFRKRVFELMDEEVIHSFARRDCSVDKFFKLEGESLDFVGKEGKNERN